jgi:hypothetical protein
MPYILNKTNGTVVATVQDAFLDLTTDLSFPGRNYAGYGEVQNENFLHLLENFSSTTAPTKPIEGQLWYNNTSKKLNAYNGREWKGVANLDTASSDPSVEKSYEKGDFWYDTIEEQVHVYNGSQFVLVGPLTGADTRAQWRGSFEYDLEESGIPKYNIKAVVGSTQEVVAIVSAETYEIDPNNASSSFPVYPTTEKIVKGITLNGADPVTGSSEAVGSYFWGTARHAANANTATYAMGVSLSVTTANANLRVPFAGSGGTLYGSTSFTFNPSTNRVTADYFDGIATSALYADIAERYESDTEYEPGTVLVLGGLKEVTVTTVCADTKVAGIVSTNPGFTLNAGVGPNNTHPLIALKGRVPCKVTGKVSKGDLLVTSSTPGYAEVATQNSHPLSILAKAIGEQDAGQGVVEVMVI